MVGVPVKVKGKDAMATVDEEFTKVVFDKVPTLKPAFKKDGACCRCAGSRQGCRVGRRS